MERDTKEWRYLESLETELLQKAGQLFDTIFFYWIVVVVWTVMLLVMFEL